MNVEKEPNNISHDTQVNPQEAERAFFQNVANSLMQAWDVKFTYDKHGKRTHAVMTMAKFEEALHSCVMGYRSSLVLREFMDQSGVAGQKSAEQAETK
jgi:hypothetical protein